MYLLGPFPYVNVWGEKIKGPEKYEDMRTCNVWLSIVLEQEWVKNYVPKAKLK